MAIQNTLSQVEALYIGYFGRAGEPDGVNYWVTQLNGGHYSWAEAAASFSVQPEATAMYPYLKFPAIENPSAFIDQVYLNLFNRLPDAEGKAYWTKELLARANDPQAVGQFILDVINGAFGEEGNPADAATIDNKIEAASYFTQALAADGIGGTHVDANGDVVLDGFLKGPTVDAVKNVTDDTATVDASKAATDDFIQEHPNPGETFTLTTGADNFVGTAKDDVFNAVETPDGWTLSPGDSLDGGAGIDTLNVVQHVIDTTVLPSLSIKNIENINLSATEDVTTDTTGWAGVTNLNIASGSYWVTATAAATTNVKITSANLDNNDITVTGGKNVSVSATGVWGGETTISGAAGDVVVHSTVAASSSAWGGDITVNGGKTVTITSATANKTANTTTWQSDVVVNGDANTTEVTVNQTKGAAASATVVGVGMGGVTITDANSASTTKAGTIESVTLNNYANSSINSGALSSVNLSGLAGTLGITAGALTTPVVSTLALNVDGLSAIPGGNAITVNGTNYKTLNLDSSGAKSTISNLIAASATAVNITGDAAIALTAQDFTAAKTITSTNTGGVTLGSALASDVLFTGGDGNDTISINGATTKTIKMGAGNDTVTISAAPGVGGSIDGGDGTDTLVLNMGGSTLATFASITNFENLRVAGAAAEGTHEAFGFKGIETGSLAANTTFNNVGPGVDLTVLAGNAGVTTTVNVLAADSRPNDVFNLHLKSAATINAGTIDLANIETINITNTDTDTSAASGINTNSLKLAATSATSITVSGNAGLKLDSTGNDKVTNFDASGVQGAAADKIALGVTYTSANVTQDERVNITGGSGNDQLRGTKEANDHINGGAGDDVLIYDGGADLFTGGAGADTFQLKGVGAKDAYLTVADAEKSDVIDVSGIIHGGGATDWHSTKITLGADASFDAYLKAAAAGDGATDSQISWFQWKGDTYLVVDNDAGTDFVSGTDAVVKLAGLVNLGAANANAAHDIFTLA